MTREPPTLIKPFPWILFLPFLLPLSIIRKSSSFCAIVSNGGRINHKIHLKHLEAIRYLVIPQNGNTENPILQKLSPMLRKVYDITLIPQMFVPGVKFRPSCEESFIMSKRLTILPEYLIIAAH